MPRRVRKPSPKPPPPQPQKNLKAVETRSRGKPPSDVPPTNPNIQNLESDIVKNWELASSNINTCVPPELWPYDDPDSQKWHIDVIHLLHEASSIDLKEKGKILCSNNEHFRSSLTDEVRQRQSRNRSASGKKSWMTAADLKKVIKQLHLMADEGEDVQANNSEKVAEGIVEEKPINVRRGRSKANNATVTEDESVKTNGTTASLQEQAQRAARARGRPKKSEPNGQAEVKPGVKRQASDLPIRPARKLRGVRSPKTKPAVPPPVTPANPPEAEDSNEEEEDEENEPPEPVSGRHIYGDFIRPSTIDFVAATDSEVPPQAKTRQTRKRGRADNEKPPSAEQIDSDPRDIDATGFLSELDPKEARRRRKPRLSRLQDDVVLEPAWSQDVLVPPETPLLTPAMDGPICGTPAAPQAEAGAAQSSPAAPPVSMFNDPDAGIALLFEMLPDIPGHATADEREMLQDRVALIRRDIVAFNDAVLEINGRVGG